MTELTQQAPYKSKPTPQKPSKNSSIEPEKWKHLYLDLPELLDTLPDLGLEAFEHVHMLRRQSLERVLQRGHEVSLILRAELVRVGNGGAEAGEVEGVLAVAHGCCGGAARGSRSSGGEIWGEAARGGETLAAAGGGAGG